MHGNDDTGYATVLATDPAYPRRLHILSDPPAQLRVWGAIPDVPYIALVGPRNPPPQQIAFTTRLAEDLVRRGWGIVSGGATGIDTAAHQGALNANGPTVVVLGSGLLRPYPEVNAPLFAAIAAKGGAVVSELPDDAHGTRWTFPRRNRLVAAWARAVVVTCAGARSGALITARIARKLGVPVGAVPHFPGDPAGAGANRLLKAGAAPIESAADVIALAQAADSAPAPKQLNLLPEKNRVKETPQAVPPGLSPLEQRIWEHLCGPPVSIDELAAALDVAVQEVTVALVEMEMAGLVANVGAQRFARVTAP